MTDTREERAAQNKDALVSIQAFYDAQLVEVPPTAKDILINYSKIPEAELLTHLNTIRTEAWKIHNYPCIGHYMFIEFGLAKSAAYPEIIERLRNSDENFLDVASGLGQDLRKLLVDGARRENIAATDIETELFVKGFDLFRDKETFTPLFVQADLIEGGGILPKFTDKLLLRTLTGQFDIIWAGSLLHQFSWSNQITAVRRIYSFFKPSAPKAIFVGRVFGAIQGQEPYEKSRFGEKSVYRHDETSLKKLLEEAAQKEGQKWEVEMSAAPFKREFELRYAEGMPEGMLDIWFVARRLKPVIIE